MRSLQAWFCHTLAGRCWASHIILPGLSFPICKMSGAPDRQLRAAPAFVFFVLFRLCKYAVPKRMCLGQGVAEDTGRGISMASVHREAFPGAEDRAFCSIGEEIASEKLAGVGLGQDSGLILLCSFSRTTPTVFLPATL